MARLKPLTNSIEIPKTDQYPIQLLEIESLLSEILADVTHPLNNPKHRDHLAFREAYDQLLRQAENMRREWLMAPESKKQKQDD